MNVKSTPPPSSESSETEDEDKKASIDNKDKGNSPECFRHLNLFILVFLAGVFAASGVALFASAYFGHNNGSSAGSTDADGGEITSYILLAFICKY